MSITRQFECRTCGAFGKIIVRGDEFDSSDIVYCPLCSSDIYEDDEEEFEDEME